MSKPPITVVAIDDHPLIREAIRSLLSDQTDITLVAEGSVGDDLFPLMEQYHPYICFRECSSTKI
jgi:DNA-binding NarL/FixJ family response regulator